MKRSFCIEEGVPEFKVMTVIETACPVCCQRIKFVQPPGLDNYEQERDFLRREVIRLRWELNKLEALTRVTAMLPPDLQKQAEEVEGRRAAALWNVYMGRA